jgi:hypothetical protein
MKFAGLSLRMLSKCHRIRPEAISDESRALYCNGTGLLIQDFQTGEHPNSDFCKRRRLAAMPFTTYCWETSRLSRSLFLNGSGCVTRARILWELGLGNPIERAFPNFSKLRNAHVLVHVDVLGPSRSKFSKIFRLGNRTYTEHQMHCNSTKNGGEEHMG